MRRKLVRLRGEVRGRREQDKELEKKVKVAQVSKSEPELCITLVC